MGDFLSGFRIGGSGMAAQRARMNTISSNLANINTTQTPEGGPYRRKDVVFSALADTKSFGDVLNVDDPQNDIQRVQVTDVVYDIPGFDDPQKRVISATINDIRVICVYIVNGESITSDKYQYKINWLQQLENFVRDSMSKYPKLALLGDFNIAPEDRDMYDPVAWKDQVITDA